MQASNNDKAQNKLAHCKVGTLLTTANRRRKTGAASLKLPEADLRGDCCPKSLGRGLAWSAGGLAKPRAPRRRPPIPRSHVLPALPAQLALRCSPSGSASQTLLLAGTRSPNLQVMSRAHSLATCANGWCPELCARPLDSQLVTPTSAHTLHATALQESRK